ncbi:MAG: cell division protein FtsQ/DivIB [Rickettsiales bacterium]|nr:cell division protein FtsQ/DivIB [Rickettsiales bacterium]
MFLDKKIASLYGGRFCKNFTIEGVKFANYDQIKQYVEKYCFQGELSLRGLRKALMGDPWISRLYIQKIIPNGLKILLVEHRPFVIFTSDHKNYLLMDDEGVRINLPADRISDFNSLFVVVHSHFDLGEIRKIFNALSSHSNLAGSVRTILRVGDRRWDLKLSNNVLVKMPEDAQCTEKTWAMVDDLLNTHGLNTGLEEIDLRIDGKIFLKYNPTIREKIEQFFRIPEQRRKN